MSMAAGGTVVTVTDPQKIGDGMGAYVSFKVNTQTTDPSFPGGTFTVLKRYSDFLWLRETLLVACPGIVVPPMPEKAVVGRFNTEFIQFRQRALQAFAQRLTRQPKLLLNEHTVKFLTASEPEWATHKAAHKNLGKSAGFLSWVSSKGSSLMSSFGGSGGAKTTEDLSFEEIANYVSELAPLLQSVLNHTQALIGRRRELAMGLYEFGLAFSMLGQSEADALGSALGKFGTVADKLSVFTNTHAEGERLFFEETLRDQIRVISAVKEALQQRDAKNAEYRGALADLESKRASVMKLKGVPGKDVQRNKAEQEVTAAQANVERARESYDEVARTVLEEMDRFKAEKFQDFRGLILDFVNLQIAYSKKLEQAWSSLITELRKVRDEEVARAPGFLEETPASTVDLDDPLPTAGAGASVSVPSQHPLSHTLHPSTPADTAAPSPAPEPAPTAAAPEPEPAVAPIAPSMGTSQDDIASMFGPPGTESLL